MPATTNPFNPPVANEPVLTELDGKPTNFFSIAWFQWFATKVARGLFAPVSSAAPATSGAAGVPGQISYDATYIYICIQANVWRRIAHNAF